MADEVKEEVQEEEKEQVQEEKKYSDSELNAILLKKNKGAVASEYKELGFESREQLMDKLKKIEEFEKGQMSETEKAKAELEAEREERKKLAAEKSESEAKLAAYKLNVDEKYISDVVRLLPDGDGTIEERMKEFLTDRPLYLKKKQEDISAEHKQQAGTEEDQVKARVRKVMGLS